MIDKEQARKVYQSQTHLLQHVEHAAKMPDSGHKFVAPHVRKLI